MPRYSKDSGSIDDSGNQLLLRRDLHFTFDRLEWIFFPHGSDWVYYALDGSVELASQFHQRTFQPIKGVRPHYLLAAFARAIFPGLNEFLRSRTDKYLYGIEAGIDDLGGKKMPGAWWFETFLPSGHRGRSASPKKRGSPSKSHSPNKRQRNVTAVAQSEQRRHYQNASSSPLQSLISK